MKILINGNYSKCDRGWEVEIPCLGIIAGAEKPITAFMTLQNIIDVEIDEEDLNSTIQVLDNGKFILTLFKSSRTMSYILKKIEEQHPTDKEIKQLLNQIRFKLELDDEE